MASSNEKEYTVTVTETKTCDICGCDRGHHEVSKRNYLIPCESDGEWSEDEEQKCDNCEYVGDDLYELKGTGSDLWHYCGKCATPSEQKSGWIDGVEDS